MGGRYVWHWNTAASKEAQPRCGPRISFLIRIGKHVWPLWASARSELCLPEAEGDVGTTRRIRHIKPQSHLCILILEINTDFVLPCQSDPKLCIFTMSSLLFCICDVRPVKWVMGSDRRWCSRWGCEKPHRDGKNPGATLVPQTRQVI